MKDPMMPDNKKQSATLVCACLSGLVSVATLVTVFVQLGSYREILLSDHARIQKFEDVGTPAIQAHVQLDDVRAKAFDQRLAAAETAARELSEMKADIREIRVQMKAWLDRQNVSAGKSTGGGSMPNW